jgi:predicted transcriptional regulator
LPNFVFDELFSNLPRLTFSGVGAKLIDRSVEDIAFEPEATATMGEAFEAARAELHEVGQLPTVRKVIAQRIIAAARRGELGLVRLRTPAPR